MTVMWLYKVRINANLFARVVGFHSHSPIELIIIHSYWWSNDAETRERNIFATVNVAANNQQEAVYKALALCKPFYAAKINEGIFKLSRI